LWVLSVQGTEIVCQVILVVTTFPKWILYPWKLAEMVLISVGTASCPGSLPLCWGWQHKG